MSPSAVEADVGECFAPGQIYVALSRATSSAGLKVTGLRKKLDAARKKGEALACRFRTHTWEPASRPAVSSGQRTST